MPSFMEKLGKYNPLALQEGESVGGYAGQQMKKEAVAKAAAEKERIESLESSMALVGTGEDDYVPGTMLAEEPSGELAAKKAAMDAAEAEEIAKVAQGPQNIGGGGSEAVTPFVADEVKEGPGVWQQMQDQGFDKALAQGATDLGRTAQMDTTLAGGQAYLDIMQGRGTDLQGQVASSGGTTSPIGNIVDTLAKSKADKDRKKAGPEWKQMAKFFRPELARKEREAKKKEGGKA